MKGSVTEFDPAAGLGAVTTEDGQHFPFHCAEVADGTRMIDVGAEVDFDVRPKLGRYEASNIVKR